MGFSNRTKKALDVSWLSIFMNVVLTVFKLVAGLIGNSSAMISDAVHSLSDVLSTFAVIIGVVLSDKADDEDHQYGHEKFESIAGSVLAVFLCLVALWIGYDGVLKVKLAFSLTLQPPGVIAVVAAGVSIVVKEFMFHFTKSVAHKINSAALLADAWHHRSDAFSSIGSLLGIVGAMVGFTALDPIASIIICVLILKVAIGIFRVSVSQTVDKAVDVNTDDSMRNVIWNTDGVLRIDELKTRIHANKIYVDTEIAVDSSLTLLEAHEIAESVHRNIEDAFPNVKHCMVHVNPYILP